MGDRSYARFSIPRRKLRRAQRKQVVADVADISVQALDAVLMGPAEAHRSAYTNETTLRMVEGTACLVIEYDSWDFGGVEAEQQLVDARIPFLRISAAGVDYGPTVSIFSGTGNPITLSVSDERDDDVLVPMTITKDRATLQASWLHTANRFARIRHLLFSP